MAIHIPFLLLIEVVLSGLKCSHMTLNVPDQEKPESQHRLSAGQSKSGVVGIWNGEGMGRV
jgi:hypothetical protein